MSSGDFFYSDCNIHLVRQSLSVQGPEFTIAIATTDGLNWTRIVEQSTESPRNTEQD